MPRKSPKKAPASPVTAAANGREEKTLPTQEEISGRPSRPANTFIRFVGLEKWRRADITLAVEQLARGRFAGAVRLLRSVKTSPAIYPPLLNRIAPMRGLPIALEAGPADGHAARDGGLQSKAMARATELFLGDFGALIPKTKCDIVENVAMLGVQVCQNIWTPSEDGRFVDPILEPFPMEFVERLEFPPTGDGLGPGLFARTLDGYERIVHGDGKWVVFSGHEAEPWTWGALMALGGVWADHAFALSFRARSGKSQGDSKWIGTLPQSVPINSKEGKAFLHELVQVSSEFQRVMLAPFGSEVKRSEAMAQNWQIFKEIIGTNISYAREILLGQEMSMDGSSQRQSNSQLYGVRNDIVEGDLETLSRAINTGVIRPWQAKNYGRVDLVKGLQWLIPDTEEDARRKSISERTRLMIGDVLAARQAGFFVYQADVNRMAKLYGVEPLKVSSEPLAPIMLEPQVNPIQMPNAAQGKLAVAA